MTTPTSSPPAVIKTVAVPVDPDRAFAIFTDRLGDWWPLATHSLFRQSAAGVTLEPRLGGDIVEESETGERAVWGTLTTWEPPARLGMWWHPGSDPADATRVIVEFVPRARGTLVTLTHDLWEQRRGDSDESRADYDIGWDIVLEQFQQTAQ